MTIAVITGGAGGMGLEVAKIMGTREDLLLVDVSQEKLDAAVEEVRGAGVERNIETAICDISDRAQVKALAEKAAGLGTIGSVIHLAGVSGQLGAELVLKVNGLGVYNMIEEFFEVMPEGSNMITVNSLSTDLNADYYDKNPEVAEMLFDHPEDPAFVAKLLATGEKTVEASGGRAPLGGVCYGLAKYFSHRYSIRNVKRFWTKKIRLNTVTPGVIATPMGILEKDGSDRMVAMMAIQEYGTPLQMATAICWLTEPNAGDITGIDLRVDGGWQALRKYPQIEA